MPFFPCISMKLLLLNETTLDFKTLKELVEEFKESLHYATPSKRLVLVLDSLDQLDTSDGGRHLHWLPRELPPNVKLILSTLPDEQYQAYQSCLVSLSLSLCGFFWFVFCFLFYYKRNYSISYNTSAKGV